MSVQHKTAPTLLVHPTTACPRCDGGRILALAVTADSSFAWRECEECRHLWALPRAWTAQADPRPPGRVDAGPR